MEQQPRLQRFWRKKALMISTFVLRCSQVDVQGLRYQLFFDNRELEGDVVRMFGTVKVVTGNSVIHI